MIPLQHCQHWIFDLDGTLTKKIFDFPKIKQRLGLPPDRGILEVMEELDRAHADRLAIELERIEWEYARKAIAAPGAGRLLRLLSERGASMGILTRNKKSHAVETLKVLGFLPYFQDPFILGRDEAAPKPDPEGVHKLLESWRVSPDQAVFVGDFQFDLMAGKAAGAATIHVDDTGHFPFGEWSDWEVHGLDMIAARLESPPAS